MARRYLRDNKELVSQWHPTKNEGIELTSLTFKSGKKVWWKCPNGEDHEWQATVDARSTGKGCPYCSGRRASSKDNLRAKNPSLARQWHAQKNADLLPEHFKSGSERKVWWQCDKNVEHAWLATIASRNVGSGCPYCAGKLASESNNLSLSHPHLAQEWHPSKNKGLSPENVTQGSGKRVWWKCAKDLKHEWRAQISDRTAGYKCPYCSRRRASDSNNLTITHPSLAEQWHPTKNLNLRPKDFTYGSGKKVWWQCGQRAEHVWQATISSRSNGHGCPNCAGTSTSAPEIRLLCEFRFLFGIDDTLWRERILGVELDIFLPKYNVAIEYDGAYWHRNKGSKDQEKNKFCDAQGLTLFRVRESPLRQITRNDVLVVSSALTKGEVNSILIKIMDKTGPSMKNKIEEYLVESSFMNDDEFKRFMSFLPSPPPEYSLKRTHHELASEWHYDKNHPLTPEHFTKGSNKKVWWRCPKGNDHVWQSNINNRVNGNGCPVCAGKKVATSNSLASVNKAISEQWHPTKNGDLSPTDVTIGSNRIVWWKCSKGTDHEWRGQIANRALRNRQCPFCARQKLALSNCLQTTHLKLSTQWHPELNGTLTPSDVMSGSKRKVWWICDENFEHVWNSSVSSRSSGRGCPFCSGQKVHETTSLETTHPDLAQEWHPTKNQKLTPRDVTSGSDKKIWWQCPRGQGHHWQSKVNNRANGSGCPFCSGRRASMSNNLLTSNPDLAQEWHLAKNLSLKPEDVKAGSHKKVWWICSANRNHEWQARIDSRKSGNGCPICARGQ